MKYFKDSHDGVYAWAGDGVPAWADSLVEISETEGEALTNPPPSLAKVKSQLVATIDNTVDAIYAAAIGNRGPEYESAEKAAQAFKDAGYTGTVPSEVQSWADAKGWTAKQACDDILAAAAQLNGAKQAIRAARLLRKEEVRNAADQAAIDTAMGEWDAFVVQVKAQLGLG